MAQQELIIVVNHGLQGERGESGPPGPSGSVATVQENEPSNGIDGMIWFNPTTKIEKIYANNAWQNTSLDGLNF